MKFCLPLASAALFALIGFHAHDAFAWGEQGHHTICEAATRLVKNPDLATFLKGRMHSMGHACNVPDIYWRDLGEIAKSGDETHFMNPENLGYTIATVPLDLNKIIQDKEGKPSEKLGRKIHVLSDLGTGWWRFDQFYRRSVKSGSDAKTMEAAALAAKKTDPPKIKEDYSKLLFAMTTNMALMGHFIGDASQPYHNSADYDGWATGQGGIHGYYETGLVNEMGLGISKIVYEKALTLRSKNALPQAATPVERIRNVALYTAPDLAVIQKLDQVETPSSLVLNPDGSVAQKVYAKRKDTSVMIDKFAPMITTELAIAALGLADAWDQLYADAGKPSFRPYVGYAYPLQPDFVAPDYDGRAPASSAMKEKKKYRQSNIKRNETPKTNQHDHRHDHDQEMSY